MGTAHRPTTSTSTSSTGTGTSSTGTSARTRGAVALGAALLAAGALGACSSSGGQTAAQAPVTTTVTSTAPATTTDGSSPTTTADGGSGGATTTTSASGTSTAAGASTVCQPSQLSLRVEAAAGGGSAGHVALELVATNSGSTVCTTQGYPGVSLVAPGNGRQLGAAADRAPGQATPLMRLEPGKTAVATIQVAQAGNYPDCGETTASGFRVYLPGTTAAAYVPFQVQACSTATIHQLQVDPFNT